MCSLEIIKLQRLFLIFFSSCDSKCEPDVLPASALFGPPLESAFENEDFSGKKVFRRSWNHQSVGYRIKDRIGRIKFRIFFQHPRVLGK